MGFEHLMYWVFSFLFSFLIFTISHFEKKTEQEEEFFFDITSVLIDSGAIERK